MIIIIVIIINTYYSQCSNGVLYCLYTNFAHTLNTDHNFTFYCVNAHTYQLYLGYLIAIVNIQYHDNYVEFYTITIRAISIATAQHQHTHTHNTHMHWYNSTLQLTARYVLQVAMLASQLHNIATYINRERFAGLNFCRFHPMKTFAVPYI